MRERSLPEHQLCSLAQYISVRTEVTSNSFGIKDGRKQIKKETQK